MKKIYTFLAVAIVSISSFAQNTSNLIVFSEDGLKFYLVLNGIRQNETALTNVKVTGLTQPYYSAKIIFEDTKQPILEKKYVPLTDADKVPQEVTYKIKRNNKMVNVMRFFNQVPMTQAAPATAEVPEVHYNTEPLPEIGTTVTTQQTTTTSNGNNGNVSIGINVPGLNMNVNVNDPTLVEGTTTTTSYTTTTTTSSSSSSNYNSTPTKPVTTKPTTTSASTGNCGGAYAMSATSFNAAKQTITNQKFDDTRLTTSKQILKTNCLSAAQIKEIMKIFSFEDTRLQFAKQAYSKCVDVNNYFLLNDAFQFESSVEELNNSIK